MKLIPRVVGILPSSWIKTASRAQWKHPLLKRSFDWSAERFRKHDGTIQQGLGKGLRFNIGQTDAGFLLGTSEPGVQRAMGHLISGGMTVYDIGANVGFLTVIAARLVGVTGRVISFEPLPSNVRQIVHNLQLNGFSQVLVRQEALGAENGNATFLVSAEPTWGKLASLGTGVGSQIGEMKVLVRKLDSAFEDDQLPAPDVIKIDVEGAEIDVLEGARELLCRERPLLMIELHGTNQGVADALKSLQYHSVVLGSSASIVNSPWDAYVIAVPLEKESLVVAVNQINSRSTDLR
jgi:FkbM family methyltransferase